MRNYLTDPISSVMKKELIAKKDQIGCPDTLFDLIVHQFLHPFMNHPLFHNQCLRWTKRHQKNLHGHSQMLLSFLLVMTCLLSQQFSVWPDRGPIGYLSFAGRKTEQKPSLLVPSDRAPRASICQVTPWPTKA